ncbi:Rne/Rng family ribonuclease [Nocardiopsis trehalosi]|uniref:Rne/Rng family ribonuclease n=1 Tax=Nocardiopsis trehalosi TaxID=109329 RepID=UPI00082FDF18|nr:Rne/Rng family ribonuclease [Nocardiopsis trehalosi]
MLDNEPNSGADGTAGTTETSETGRTTTFAPPQDGEVRVSGPTGRRSGASRSAGPPPEPDPAPVADGPLTTLAGAVEAAPPVESVPAEAEPAVEAAAPEPAAEEKPKRTRARRTTAAASSADDKPKRTRARRAAAPAAEPPAADDAAPAPTAEEPAAEPATAPGVAFQPPMVVFQPPVAPITPAAGNGAAHDDDSDDDTADDDDVYSGMADDDVDTDTDTEADAAHDDDSDDDDRPSRRRRRRGGRGRGKSRIGEDDTDTEPAAEVAEPEPEARDAADTDTDDGESGGSRRRRRRRRRSGGDDDAPAQDDPPNTVVRVREPRAEKPIEDEVQAVRGSTRLEAKKQRRREGREQGRRRTPIITESEFLARREAVKRDLVIRRTGERTQIAVLEDDVLVEHYVDRATHKSYVGNVYLGRVQNVLPSMEAAFVDIGKGRNAVLYAGEVNWDASGLEGQPKRIESVLKSGQSVLVQVTKDPLGHKGARLTSQISLPGRYLVYVPDGSMTGISRKLPDKERARLKQILKKVMPENAGVIVRTAAEGASEEELERDISRLAAQWESIKRKSKSATAPALLNSEPDLTVKVVRDVFNEDFSSLVVAGGDAWETVREYVDYVAPNLAERVSHWTGDRDVFEAYRIDEQIAKALDRKVWLPSGGSLVIDRTEAMTVVDVNTGKFTGQGGNLEETVTKNNLEAAEEIVRQLRLRDIGGIIVIDFIDMVLESNRDLVLRRMLECLSRDRTKHQVAEVTSLGLVQMTRKRVGQGLLEAFSHTCEHCGGRGLVISTEPVEARGGGNGGQSGSGGGKKKKGRADKGDDKAKDDKPKGEDKSAKADDAAAKGEEQAESGPAPADTAGEATGAAAETAEPAAAEGAEPAAAPAKTRKAPAKRASRKKAAPAAEAPAAADAAAESGDADTAPAEGADAESGAEQRPRRRRTRRTKAAAPESAVVEAG